MNRKHKHRLVKAIYLEESTLFPAKALVNWAETRYSNPNDQYAQKLKQAHLKAIRNRNVRGVQKLANVMFVQMSFLRKESPEEYQALAGLYKKVKRWLESRKKG